MNTNELNQYVENFGTVVKKLDGIAEINDKVEQVSALQDKTVEELHEQWDKTLPEINKQIEDLKTMIAKAEVISQSQAELLNSLGEKLQTIETSVQKSAEQNGNKIDALGQNISTAADSLGQKASDNRIKIDGVAEAINENLQVQKKGNTLQMITLIVACIAAILGVVNLIM